MPTSKGVILASRGDYLVEDMLSVYGPLPISFIMVFMQARLILPISQYCEKSLLEKRMNLLSAEETNTLYPLFSSSHNK